MTIPQILQDLYRRYQILDVCDVDKLDNDPEILQSQIRFFCQRNLVKEYQNNQRLIFVVTSEVYDHDIPVRLSIIQKVINDIDISNFFVVIVTTNPSWQQDLEYLNSISIDKIPVTILLAQGEFQRGHGIKSAFLDYKYGSPDPIKIPYHELNDREKFLLVDSKVFCIYPWIHLHAYPTGQAYPCCHAEMAHPVGNCKTQTLAEIWQGSPMQELRKNMLNEQPSAACARCYEQEASGFFSGRRSANKHHGHHIKKLDTNPFEMIYWDIRFSNLCNLRCRSCGHIFSSQWYQDQAALAGPEWKQTHQVLNYAGRTNTDIWEQLLPHIDYVEQIYFAGGEPLLMEEHYRILDELERRDRFDVRLIYNTNFTHTDLKGRSVFDYWKRFNSVAVGASLDAMGPRAEYIRKGTDWAVVEANRRSMIEICPEVDFYISPTLSIMNAWHLPDFHRAWTEAGLIRAQDLNVNILQDPDHYRIDIAPQAYKEKLRKKFQEHLEWLRPQDALQRATVGFESAISFMMATDNTPLIEQFWRKTYQLDELRKEKILDIIPELEALQ